MDYVIKNHFPGGFPILLKFLSLFPNLRSLKGLKKTSLSDPMDASTLQFINLRQELRDIINKNLT